MIWASDTGVVASTVNARERGKKEVVLMIRGNGHGKRTYAQHLAFRFVDIIRSAGVKRNSGSGSGQTPHGDPMPTNIFE
jgi:hypothetical protein